MSPQLPIQPSFNGNNTAWQQRFAGGTSSDFIVLQNFDRRKIFDVLLPLIESEPSRINFGGPYRKNSKKHLGGRHCVFGDVSLKLD